MDLTWIAQMGRRVSSSEHVESEAVRIECPPPCRPEVPRESLKAYLQRLMASYAKSAIALQDRFVFVDTGKEVPDSPQIGKAEFTWW